MMNTNSLKKPEARRRSHPQPFVPGVSQEIETGPQTYLELLRLEMARERMLRRDSKSSLLPFELTFYA